jgi:hypothetical protein
MMNVFRMVSNQWSVGVGLRRSTIIGESRWSFWVNHGYGTFSLSWGFNKRKAAPQIIQS